MASDFLEFHNQGNYRSVVKPLLKMAFKTDGDTLKIFRKSINQPEKCFLKKGALKKGSASCRIFLTRLVFFGLAVVRGLLPRSYKTCFLNNFCSIKNRDYFCMTRELIWCINKSSFTKYTQTTSKTY